MIALLQDLSTVMPDLSVWGSHALALGDWSFHPWGDAFQASHLHLPWDLAQNFKQTDLGGDVSKAFDKFVKTGQAWAFLIGLILGYLVRSFTSFG